MLGTEEKDGWAIGMWKNSHYRSLRTWWFQDPEISISIETGLNGTSSYKYFAFDEGKEWQLEKRNHSWTKCPEIVSIWLNMRKRREGGCITSQRLPFRTKIRNNGSNNHNLRISDSTFFLPSCNYLWGTVRVNSKKPFQQHGTMTGQIRTVSKLAPSEDTLKPPTWDLGSFKAFHLSLLQSFSNS